MEEAGRGDGILMLEELEGSFFWKGGGGERGGVEWRCVRGGWLEGWKVGRREGEDD